MPIMTSVRNDTIMWDEIQDMEGEIFDLGDITDEIPSILNLSDETMDEIAALLFDS